MDEHQRRVARVALAAGANEGWALGGGGALAAHGLTTRANADVDLFVDRYSDDRFRPSVRRMVDAWRADGLAVQIRTAIPGFMRFEVTDSAGAATAVDALSDPRRHPTVTTAVGATISRDDAVAGKMVALITRGAERDHLDIHEAITSGAYTSQEVLRLADAREGHRWDRQQVTEALLLGARDIRRAAATPDEFTAALNLDATRAHALQEVWTGWAGELQAERDAAAALAATRAGLRVDSGRDNFYGNADPQAPVQRRQRSAGCRDTPGLG